MTETHDTPESPAPSNAPADAPATESASPAQPAEAPEDVKVPEEAKALDEPLPEPTGDPLFDAMWAKVLQTWDDDKVHNAILDYAVTAEKLPDLAGHYRALKDDPAKGERSKKRLDAIIIAATSLMMSMRTPSNVKVPLSITFSVVGLCACAVMIVAYAMFHR